jgi:Spy/CpxP family protein refolding chaperone
MEETFEKTHTTRRRAPGLCAALSAVLLAASAAAGARAQDDPPEDLRPPAARPGQPRVAREEAAPDLVRALNLSRQQRAEIARIRREVALQTRAANQRVRRARLALEEAVYAPSADGALIDERAAELAAAEGARIRLRAQTELSIRRLLTPAQLDAFRELRLRARARMQGLQDRRPAALPRRPRP